MKNGVKQNFGFGPDAPNSGAGAAAIVSPSPRVAIGEALHAQITDALRLARGIQAGEVKGDIAANFRFADDVLLSIFSHWKDELRRLEKEVRDALPAEARDVLAYKGDSIALWVLNTFVLDFSRVLSPSKPSMAMLITLLENALDGRVNLFVPREVVVYCPPRRWTRRWWKESFQKSFLAIRASLRGVRVPGRPDAPVHAAVAPAAPVPAPVPSKPACQCEICCNPS